jgi:predicted permease
MAAGGWPAVVASLVSRIGATLTPVALFSIGLQFTLHLDRSRLGAAVLALGWKLAVAPLLIYLLGFAVGARGLVLTVGGLEAAMAPMISTAILAAQYQLDREVATTALGGGLILSLISVPWMGHLLP